MGQCGSWDMALWGWFVFASQRPKITIFQLTMFLSTNYVVVNEPTWLAMKTFKHMVMPNSKIKREDHRCADDKSMIDWARKMILLPIHAPFLSSRAHCPITNNNPLKKIKLATNNFLTLNQKIRDNFVIFKTILVLYSYFVRKIFYKKIY